LTSELPQEIQRTARSIELFLLIIKFMFWRRNVLASDIFYIIYLRGAA